MLIRCDDCGSRAFNQWTKTSWHPLPADFFGGGKALSFWMTLHGHVPTVWVFRCEACGATMESGGLVAIQNGWDDIALAQNDWGFYEEHKTCSSRSVVLA
jgi:hypothetical protein